MASKLYRALHEPLYIPWCLWHKISPLIKSDEFYLKMDYFLALGKKLNLDNPKTFNEKLQWLKVNDKRAEYSVMVDKYEVKEYVKNLIGEKHVIPTLAVWDNPEEIDVSALPNQFVLKCTHDSGCVILCHNKKDFDLESAKKRLKRQMAKDFYLEHREYPYKNVKHRVIAEELLVDESGTELKDYKFFCFNGKCKMLFIVSGRPTHTKLDFLDTHFNLLPFERGYPRSGKLPYKPSSFEKMIEFSEKLSKDIPFVRVDFYDVNGVPYFGELTFFPGSGCEPFKPEEWDYKIGEWLKLPACKSY